MSFAHSSFRPPGRLASKKTIKPVNFICFAPEANKVTLSGDFNHWDPEGTQMTRQADGSWVTQVELGHGHHQYVFIVDGTPTLDPKAQGIARNPKNERVSLIAV